MRIIKLFSKTIHIAMIFCFCLPFLKGCSGCGVSPEELAAKAKAEQDSIAAYSLNHIENTTDTVAISLAFDSSQTIIPDTSRINPTLPAMNNKSIWVKFLSAVLQPNGDFSGLGLIVFGIQLGGVPIYMGLLICLLLIIISLCISFQRKNTYKLIFVFSIIELLFLSLFYLAIGNYSEILYGYWLVFVLSLFNSITAFIIRKRSKPIKHISDP